MDLASKIKIGIAKKIWIWIWYNDKTRFCCIIGLPVIPVVILIAAIFGNGEYLRAVAMILYGILFCWMLIDNDYSNLIKIGLDEYRNKISRN